MSLRVISSLVGFATNSPLMRPTLRAPTGPFQGMSETMRAAEAPRIDRTSASCFPSAEKSVETICTSLLNPSGKRGLSGRSVILAVRISFSVGRPSRLKYPPGIFPAAAKRSRYSTESGKKSIPSLGAAAQAQTRTVVPPCFTTTEPLARSASLPVSMDMERPPPMSMVTCSRLIISHLLSAYRRRPSLATRAV